MYNIFAGFEMADGELTNQKMFAPALQSALQKFDGVKVASLIQRGLDIRNIRLDRQNHNAIHELVLNYIQLQSGDSPEKLHIKFLDTLTVLVENGLDINEGNSKAQTALHMAASSPGNVELLRALLVHGARINQPDSGQQTALHKAVLHGSVEEVAVLLERDADPNHVDNVGYSPIHLAVKRKLVITPVNCTIFLFGHLKLQIVLHARNAFVPCSPHPLHRWNFHVTHLIAHCMYM